MILNTCVIMFKKNLKDFSVQFNLLGEILEIAPKVGIWRRYVQGSIYKGPRYAILRVERNDSSAFSLFNPLQDTPETTHSCTVYDYHTGLISVNTVKWSSKGYYFTKANKNWYLHFIEAPKREDFRTL